MIPEITEEQALLEEQKLLETVQNAFFNQETLGFSGSTTPIASKLKDVIDTEAKEEYGVVEEEEEETIIFDTKEDGTLNIYSKEEVLLTNTATALPATTFSSSFLEDAIIREIINKKLDALEELKTNLHKQILELSDVLGSDTSSAISNPLIDAISDERSEVYSLLKEERLNVDLLDGSLQHIAESKMTAISKALLELI